MGRRKFGWESCVVTGRVLLLLVLFSACVARTHAESLCVGFRDSLASTVLGKQVRLSVHVPAHQRDSETRYPVLYIFQLHFEQVTGAVMGLYDQGLAPEMIVVRVDNYEFGYLSPVTLGEDPGTGQANRFLEFFADELFPYVDSRYPTHPYRIVFSNSFGGAFAVYAVVARPEVFDAAIASVPMVTYEGKSTYLLENARRFLEERSYNHFLYLVMDDETEFLADLETFVTILRQANTAGLTWEYHHWPEDDHTSTPYRAAHSGIRALFRDWNSIPDSTARAGLAAIQKQESSSRARFGYDIGISPFALHRAGVLLEREDRLPEAISVYRYRVEKQPRNPMPYVALGRAYEKAGQPALARAAYETGYKVAIDTSHPQAKWVRRFLDELDRKTPPSKEASEE